MGSLTLPSMTISDLNNFVIKLRKPAKTSRAQVVQKLIRKLKKLESQKEDRSNKETKIERTLKEIEILKKTHVNVLITFSLCNKNNLVEASKYSSIEVMAFTRFCCQKVIAAEVAKWRRDHADWERLANYWKNHVSQRKRKTMAGKETLLAVERVLLGHKEAVVALADRIAQRKRLNSGGSCASESSDDGDERIKDEKKEEEDEEEGSIEVDKTKSSRKADKENIEKISKDVTTSNANESIVISKSDKFSHENVAEDKGKKDKGKSKNKGAAETEIRNISAKKVVEYDSKEGIKRFVMEEMAGEEEMKMEVSSGHVAGMQVDGQSNKKVSGMFEGGEDEEEEEEDDGQENDAKVQINQSKSAANSKFKHNKDFSKKGWDNKKQKVSNKKEITKSQKNPKKFIKTSKNTNKKKDKEEEDKDMHPSWLAKKKLKEQQNATFVGKKVVFDD